MDYGRLDNDDYALDDSSSDDDEGTVVKPVDFLKCNTSKKGKWAGDEHNSSEDEFALEMESELDSRMLASQTNNLPVASMMKPNDQPTGSGVKSDTKFYDDVYFDSDSDEEGGTKKSNRKVLSDNDLLYDPEEDDRDQKWMDDLRKGYLPKNFCANNMKMPNSDAVLNCPACFCLLCMDCQRHELYNTQYRAMFVFNCKVDLTQQLEQLPKPKSKSRRKKKGNKEEDEDNTPGIFHPVHCTECNTKVAVRDVEEVYHFFNVIASHT